MKCENPEGCDRPATSVDHFTPICIAKVLGWSKDRWNDSPNLQDLCQPCHASKDRSTPAKLAQVKFQLRGGTILFGSHK